MDFIYTAIVDLFVIVMLLSIALPAILFSSWMVRRVGKSYKKTYKTIRT